MAEVIKAWQCIGCGRLEGHGQCVGVCQDRPVDLVSAADYAALAARLEALEAIARRIALTHPKKGEAAATWEALQGQARAALGLAA
jgi:hypothetical protein